MLTSLPIALASRVLIPAKTGLAETSRYTALPQTSSNEIRDCLKQIHSTFVVLNNVVNRYLENERKSKWTKGFRLFFSENEIDKLRLSLIQCREALSARPEAKTVSEKERSRVTRTTLLPGGAHMYRVDLCAVALSVFRHMLTLLPITISGHSKRSRSSPLQALGILLLQLCLIDRTRRVE
jgi:hypothetical protein